VSRKYFAEDRIFIISWGIFTALATMLFLGVIAAPLFVRWELHGVADFLYGFYHLTCHQMPARSWFIDDVQLAVCVRCFSTYLFLIPASGALFFRPVREWLRGRSFLKFVLPASFALLFPLAADGFVQLLTPWESTHLLRFVTGGLASAGMVLFLGNLYLKFSERIEASLR